MDALEVALLERQQAFVADQRRDRKDKQPQLPFASQIKGDRQHQHQTPRHFEKLKIAEQAGIVHGDIETGVKEEQQHRKQAGRPIRARFASSRPQHGADQKAEGQDVEHGNFKTARGPAIPLAADEIDIQQLDHRPQEDQQHKKQIAHPLRKAGQQAPADHCRGNHRQSEYCLQAHIKSNAGGAGIQ